MKSNLRGLCAFGWAVALIGLAGCASTEKNKRAQVTMEQVAVVTVESMDVPSRLVTVRDTSGNRTTYYVSQSVRDFPQAKVGDQVRIRYEESMALQMKKPSDGAAEVGMKSETTKAQPSGTHRGGTRTETTATVKIEKVDKDANTVTFTGPRGRRTVLVTNPTMQEFTDKLKPGDMVEVTYVEALALSLEPI